MATDEEAIIEAQRKLEAIRAHLAQTSDIATAANFSESVAPRKNCRRCNQSLPPERSWQCAECDAAIEEARVRWVEREATSRIEAALARSGLPVAYRTGIRDLSAVRDSEAADLANAVLCGEDCGLYLHGKAGPDKTTLAASTLALWIAAGNSGMFVSVIDLMTDIHSTYGDNPKLTRGDLVKPLIETPMLVLDDLGKEKASDHAAGVIFQILDGRYRLLTARTHRPLVVTSNWSLADLCFRFTGEETGEPIRRRLSEMTVALEMK